MSDGLKVGLVIGAAAVGYFVLRAVSPATLGLAPAAPPLGASPGAPNAAAITTPPAGSTTAISKSGVSVSWGTAGKVLAAPVYYPTVAVVDAAKWVGGLF